MFLVFQKRIFRISHKTLKFYSQQNFRNHYAMKTVYFRQNPTDSQLQINFRYTNPSLSVDRDFNFSRKADESISTCLERMKNNIEKELNKKSKKKKQKKTETPNKESNTNSIQSEVSINFLKDNNKVENTLTFSQLLGPKGENTKNLILQIDEEKFEISFNTPWIENIALPTSILAGFLVYPSKIDLHFGEKKYCIGEWFKGILSKSKDINAVQWEKVHEGLSYMTNVEDIGCLIKFQCTPGNGHEFGPKAECISKNEIQAGPGSCLFDNRHKFTETKLGGNLFRVTSYNILADLYADSDYSRKELFPYCPTYSLHIDYRKQLFIKEIIGYNSDIICLQEVDAKVFDYDLLPVLDNHGYSGILQKKGKTAEGIATFYNRERFECVRTYGFTIGEVIPKEETFKILWDKIKSNEPLVKRIVDRTTALQVNILRSLETDNFLLVANTHLYFHPDADHIRLLQAAFSMIYVDFFYKKALEELNINKEKLSIIFCGDFNSVPECGIYKLMTEKFVGEDFIDWSSNQEEAVKEVSLNQPFNFESACGCPQYTNFTTLFAACLDYIFYQTDNLEVQEVIPLPSEEELKTHTAIPSVIYPSDHVALVANLKWKHS